MAASQEATYRATYRVIKKLEHPELPWAANILYMGPYPAARGTVRLDYEGISLDIGGEVWGWCADEIGMVIARDCYVSIWHRGFHRLELDDPIAAVCMRCLCEAYYTRRTTL